MDRKAVIAMMAMFKAAWPAFYRQESDVRAAVEVWAGAMAEYPEDAVLSVVRRLIKSSTFPPAIAEVCRPLDAVREVEAGESADAVWAKVYAAICDSTYHAPERFDALPDVGKRFVGDAKGLRALGMTDEDTVQTVTRGQFFKQYPVLSAAERTRRELSSAALLALCGQQARIADGGG